LFARRQNALLSSPRSKRKDLAEAVKRKHLKAEIAGLDARIEEIHNRHKKRHTPDGDSYSFTWADARDHNAGEAPSRKENSNRVLEQLGVGLVLTSDKSRFIVNFIAPDAPPELQNILGWALRAVVKGKEQKILEQGTTVEVNPRHD